MTSEGKALVDVFNSQAEVTPNFGAEAFDSMVVGTWKVAGKTLKAGSSNSVPKRDTSPQTLADVDKIMKDGYLIIPNLLSAEQLAKTKAVCHTLQKRYKNPFGRNLFEGAKTKRVNNVANKSSVMDEMLLHPRILNVLDHVLSPNFLLTVTQSIEIFPGERKQTWHFDDGSCRQPRPRRHLFVNCFWAIDDFTEENGATHLIPGSHLWGEDQLPDLSNGQPGIRAVCKAGSCILYLSTAWHSGGANNSSKPRMGLVSIFGESWMRPYDNHFLATHPRDVLKMPPRLQSLLGYSIGAPQTGWHDGGHPLKALKRKEEDVVVDYFERMDADELIKKEGDAAKL